MRRRGFEPLSASFDTRPQAERWAAQVEGRMAEGRFVNLGDAERTSLAEALDRYVAEVSVRKRWGEKERYIANALKRHPLKDRALAYIRGADIAKLIAELEGEGLGPNRIRLYLALLSHLFTVARIEWGMEGLHNPMKGVRRPKPAPGRERRLKPGEEQRLLEACDVRLSKVVEFALETAMRQGEIAALRWQYVDLARRVAHLPLTKNGLARDVPLSTRAVEILQSLPRRLDGFVFGPAGYSHAFAQACRKAGIEDLHFHDLRHEATSRLFERGLGIETVASITGHKTWAMLRRYTHLQAEDIARQLG